MEVLSVAIAAIKSTQAATYAADVANRSLPQLNFVHHAETNADKPQCL